ncbi:hypothetical protein DBR43_33060 [Pedobacter sp. KBW06]|uniref:ribonuclease E inhibitor RraB n=1 Tax=Pedobacter sp. KBW06 TaxID=2153359 RepID=UPI000F59AA63|nr:ribonuclease E inhibitor RraB [Pedobacter sp. KBW06]RQO64364.1 hypothetical protein DBR43_33060 [Pedobacter sp. KBW06]
MQTDLTQLKSIFIKMNEDGFDTKSSLKWSFYFIDTRKDKLELLFRELKDYNYVIEKFDFNKDDEWVLQVSKIDSLTPEKLHKRNIAFNELADFYDAKLYDGWDVEKL